MSNKSYYDKLSEIADAKLDRINAIDRRSEEIQKMNFRIMATAELETLREEVYDLQSELIDHKRWLAKAKKERAEFYAPAIKVG